MIPQASQSALSACWLTVSRSGPGWEAGTGLGKPYFRFDPREVIPYGSLANARVSPPSR